MKSNRIKIQQTSKRAVIDHHDPFKKININESLTCESSLFTQYVHAYFAYLFFRKVL